MNPLNNHGASSSMSFISPWPYLLADYPHVRHTSLTDEIIAAAGAEGKNPSRLDFKNR
jgi:hypothetical protein